MEPTCFYRHLHGKALLLLMIGALGGCTSTRKYGDLRLRHTPPVFAVVPDSIHLKPFPIDRRGEHRFAVRNLPTPMIPTHLHVRSEHGQQNPPWRMVKLEVVFQSVSGTVLWRMPVGMERHREGHWHLSVPIGIYTEVRKALGDARNYDVVVVVTQPSKARGDRAFLGSSTAWSRGPR